MDFDIHDIKVFASLVSTEATHEEIQQSHMAFRGVIEKMQGAAFDLELIIAGSSLRAMWKPTGKGAGTMEWADGKEVPAVTIVCAGYDPVADRKAIEDYLDRYKPSKEIADRLANSKPAFMTTAYYSDRAILKLRLCGLSIGFGNAFFERLPPLP